MNIKHELLPPGSRVLCAVSGGADSMCLLHLLKNGEAALGITVCAAHFEHGLRGAEALRDAAFVEQECARLNVPCRVGHGDTPAYAAQHGLGLEEAARALRYAFLERTADELGCTLIATAHTADDNTETLLMNLLRGSGTKGLGGIPPQRGRIVRPLLETQRSEIEAYLREHGLAHVEDSSNADLAFTRNRLRHELLPLLREFNPRLNESLGRTAALLRQDADCLDEQARRWLAARFDGESLSCAQLLALHPALASRAARLLCPKSLSAAQTQALLRFAAGTERGFLDLPGLRLRREGGRLYVGPEARVSFPPRRIVPGAATDFPELGLRVRAEKNSGGSAEIHSQFKTYRLGYENISGELVCTPRTPGDRMHPAGRGCGKSLKALFLEAGLTRAQRDAALVFRDGAGILAVHPLALDERAVPGPGGPELLITVEPIEKERQA